MARAPGHFPGGQNVNNPNKQPNSLKNRQYPVSKCTVTRNPDGSANVTTWRYVSNPGDKPVKKIVRFTVTKAGYDKAIQLGYFTSGAN